jgi:uncharacterized protein
MSNKERYLDKYLLEDLQKKMVFLGGPRQVGKTTLAQTFLKNFKDGHQGYLNWDDIDHKEKILQKRWPATQKLIILDEIHKYKDWRNLIKGFFDTLKNSHQFFITGSARLDYFRKGGDSLIGRYFYYRLHPFSFSELGDEYLKDLFNKGGFPEPLFSNDIRDLKRWRSNRVSRLVREDLRDIANVSDIDKVALLAQTLPQKVGSPLSVKSLCEDLDVDHKTAKRWLDILESLYYCYRISPFGGDKIRAVKKEQKLYLWDWGQVENEGHRFENMIAGHLLKFCHFHEDVNGDKMELRYIRDTDKREVDFVVIKNDKPLFAVEAKLNGRNLSPHIPYFQERLNIPKYYQVSLEGEDRNISDEIKIVSLKSLSALEELL